MDTQPEEPEPVESESWADRARRLDAEQPVAKVMASPTHRLIRRSPGARTDNR